MKKLEERTLAKANKDKYYFTGKPCKHNHIANRYTISGFCTACLANKTIRNRNQKTELAYRERNRNRIKARVYNLTEQEYFDLIWKQENKCKICNKFMNGTKERHIDHCHNTKKVRGLLCRDCNLGLGNFKHNSEFLKQAALYCEQSK